MQSYDSNPTYLPQQLEHLTNLISLLIEDFNSIESLPKWLGNFTSLMVLDLFQYKNSKNLLSKEAMSNMSGLNYLTICKILIALQMVLELDIERCANEEAKPRREVDTRRCANKDVGPRKKGVFGEFHIDWRRNEC